MAAVDKLLLSQESQLRYSWIVQHSPLL